MAPREVQVYRPAQGSADILVQFSVYLLASLSSLPILNEAYPSIKPTHVKQSICKLTTQDVVMATDWEGWLNRVSKSGMAPARCREQRVSRGCTGAGRVTTDAKEEGIGQWEAQRLPKLICDSIYWDPAWH